MVSSTPGCCILNMNNNKVLTFYREGELTMVKDNKLSFQGQHIYVGIDTGKKSWTVTLYNIVSKWHFLTITKLIKNIF